MAVGAMQSSARAATAGSWKFDWQLFLVAMGI
jgi:hypothetical protein